MDLETAKKVLVYLTGDKPKKVVDGDEGGKDKSKRLNSIQFVRGIKKYMDFFEDDRKKVKEKKKRKDLEA